MRINAATIRHCVSVNVTACEPRCRRRPDRLTSWSNARDRRPNSVARASYSGLPTADSVQSSSSSAGIGGAVSAVTSNKRGRRSSCSVARHELASGQRSDAMPMLSSVNCCASAVGACLPRYAPGGALSDRIRGCLSGREHRSIPDDSRLRVARWTRWGPANEMDCNEMLDARCDVVAPPSDVAPSPGDQRQCCQDAGQYAPKWAFGTASQRSGARAIEEAASDGDDDRRRRRGHEVGVDPL